ncbi:MAG: hypothetical protein WD535_00575 [Thermaerobacterales bacterium]
MMSGRGRSDDLPLVPGAGAPGAPETPVARIPDGPVADMAHQVAAAGGLLPENAAALIRQVVHSLVQSCGDAARSELEGIFPPEWLAGRGSPTGFGAGLSDAADAGDELIDREIFIGRMVQASDTEYGYDQTLGGLDLISSYRDDDAVRWVTAVFAALKGQLDLVGCERLAQSLPPEVAGWFRSA